MMKEGWLNRISETVVLVTNVLFLYVGDTVEQNGKKLMYHCYQVLLLSL